MWDKIKEVALDHYDFVEFRLNDWTCENDADRFRARKHMDSIEIVDGYTEDDVIVTGFKYRHPEQGENYWELHVSNTDDTIKSLVMYYGSVVMYFELNPEIGIVEMTAEYDTPLFNESLKLRMARLGEPVIISEN